MDHDSVDGANLKPQTTVLAQSPSNIHPVDETVLAVPQSEPVMRIFANLVRILLKIFLTYWLYSIGNNAWPIVGFSFLFLEVLEFLFIALNSKKMISTMMLAGLSSIASVAAINIFLLYSHKEVSVFSALYVIHMTSALSRFQKTGAIFATSISVVTYAIITFLTQPTPQGYLSLFFLILIGWRFVDIGRLLDDLYKERRQILAIDKMKNDMIAIISHNLRTPIAAIRGYFFVLQRGDAGELNKDQLKILDNADQNIKQLQQVSEEVISLSIMESQSYQIITASEDYIKVIADVVETARANAEKKGLTFTYYVMDHHLPPIMIDRKKISLVLNNLLDNAIKFTEKGGITVEIRFEKGYVVTNVSDTGVGIAKDQQLTLFDKFHRIGNILVYAHKGAGLGLYLCKTIVELHHGKIWVTSEEGKGTTMSFRLPVTKL